MSCFCRLGYCLGSLFPTGFFFCILIFLTASFHLSALCPVFAINLLSIIEITSMMCCHMKTSQSEPQMCNRTWETLHWWDFCKWNHFVVCFVFTFTRKVVTITLYGSNVHPSQPFVAMSCSAASVQMWRRLHRCSSGHDSTHHKSDRPVLLMGNNSVMLLVCSVEIDRNCTMSVGMTNHDGLIMNCCGFVCLCICVCMRVCMHLHTCSMCVVLCH